MTIANAFRFWFLGLYVVGFIAIIAANFRLRARLDDIEKQVGPIPTPGMLIPIGIPPIILLTGIGEISGAYLPLRLIGLVLSIYSVVMLPWAMRTLGEMAVPGVGIYGDHELITSGPYRYVRHPGYSAILTLWLSVGLGTVNWLLILLWPLAMIFLFMFAIRPEETLLRESFGDEYEDYSQRTARLVPKFW